MSNRHLSRIIAMQSLYEQNFRDQKKIDEIIKRNIDQRDKEGLDDEYICKVCQGVIENTGKIDKLIEKSAPEWPIDQVAAVDKTILRLAIFEMLFDKSHEVPPKVSIDEAVELAKTFGGENSSKFVNGVLGSVYRASDIYNPAEDKKILKEKRRKKDIKKDEDAT